KVSFFPVAQGLYFRIVRGPLHAMIPGMIVVRSVAIVLSIGFVVLLVVADQVAQREAVVGRDKINTGRRAAAVALVKIAAAGQAVTEFGKLSLVALPVAPHHIAISSVPFRP